MTDKYEEFDDKVYEYYSFEDDIHRIVLSCEQNGKYTSIVNAHSVWKEISASKGKHWVRQTKANNDVFALVDDKYFTDEKNTYDWTTKKHNQLRTDYKKRMDKGLTW